MTFKTILVHGGPDQRAEARLKAAQSVGRMFGSALTVAGAEAWVPYPIFTDSAYINPDLVQAQREDIDKRLVEAKAAYDRLCGGYEEPHAWRQAEFFPDQYLIELAKGADLLVAGCSEKGDTECNFADPANLVMQAGAPVLLVPPEVESVACAKVLVAWKDTNEARRALAASLPLLKRAEKVILLEVLPTGTAPHHQHDVLERLRRHGVEVTPDVRTSTTLGDGHDLLEAALAHRADLVVAGAYGHSRLREWAFGGVTSTLLRRPHLPVFFSR